MVDAYNSEERAMSWYYYLEEKLAFPFKAKCTVARAVLPPKIGEEVEVLDLEALDDCKSAILVLIGFAGRTLGVPLAQLEANGADAATREAVALWRYWVVMGHEF